MVLFMNEDRRAPRPNPHKNGISCTAPHNDSGMIFFHSVNFFSMG